MNDRNGRNNPLRRKTGDSFYDQTNAQKQNHHEVVKSQKIVVNIDLLAIRFPEIYQQEIRERNCSDYLQTVIKVFYEVRLDDHYDNDQQVVKQVSKAVQRVEFLLVTVVSVVL